MKLYIHEGLHTIQCQNSDSAPPRIRDFKGGPGIMDQDNKQNPPKLIMTCGQD